MHVKQKMWTQKVCHNNIKKKFKFKIHHQMKNLKIRYIKTFSIQEQYDL
jgi:hypothetical protein